MAHCTTSSTEVPLCLTNGSASSVKRIVVKTINKVKSIKVTSGSFATRFLPLKAANSSRTFSNGNQHMLANASQSQRSKIHRMFKKLRRQSTKQTAPLNNVLDMVIDIKDGRRDDDADEGTLCDMLIDSEIVQRGESKMFDIELIDPTSDPDQDHSSIHSYMTISTLSVEELLLAASDGIILIAPTATCPPSIGRDANSDAASPLVSLDSDRTMAVESINVDQEPDALYLKLAALDITEGMSVRWDTQLQEETTPHMLVVDMELDGDIPPAAEDTMDCSDNTSGNKHTPLCSEATLSHLVPLVEDNRTDYALDLTASSGAEISLVLSNAIPPLATLIGR